MGGLHADAARRLQQRSAALQREAQEKFAAGARAEAVERQREAVLLLAELRDGDAAGGSGAHADAVEALAHYHLAAGDTAAARAALHEVLAALGDTASAARRARALELQGVIAVASQEHEQARAAWTAAVALRRAGLAEGGAATAELARALLRLGKWHAVQAQWAEAVTHLAEAAEHYAGDAEASRSAEFIDALNLLSTAHYFAGRIAEAIAVLERAVALARTRVAPDGLPAERPAATDLMNHLGRLYREAGRLGEGRAILGECVAECRAAVALRRDPAFRNRLAAALNRLGQCCAELGEPQAAEAHLSESVALMRELVEREGHAALADDLVQAVADLARAKGANAPKR